MKELHYRSWVIPSALSVALFPAYQSISLGIHAVGLLGVSGFEGSRIDVGKNIEVAVCKALPFFSGCNRCLKEVIRELKFATFNVVIFAIGMFVFGYPVSTSLAIGVSVSLFLYFLLKRKFDFAVFFPLIYLVDFDNPHFTYTSYNIRIYYPFIFLSVLFFAISRTKRGLKIRKYNLFLSLAILYFLMMSVMFLFFENTFTDLNNLKYWIASFPLTFVFLGTVDSEKRKQLMKFYMNCATFVSVFGILQYFANTRGIPVLQYNYYNIRPSGFFSETTWYGEYNVFGLIVLLYLHAKREVSNKTSLLVGSFFVVGILLSATRNAFLGLFIILVYLNFTNIRRLSKALITTMSLVTSSLIANEAISRMTGNNLLLRVLHRFTTSDQPGGGRVAALRLSLSQMDHLSYFLGNGFTFNPITDSTASGVAIGAKAENMYLFFLYIFGIVGLLFIVGLIFHFYVRNLATFRTPEKSYGILGFTCFIIMANFAPLHQYGMSLVFLGIVFLLTTDLSEPYPHIYGHPIEGMAQGQGLLRAQIRGGLL